MALIIDAGCKEWGRRTIIQYLTSDSPLDCLPLSVRSYNALRNNNVKTVGQLFTIPVDELYKIRNLGEKSVVQIQDILNDIKEGKNGQLFVPDHEEPVEKQRGKTINLFYDRQGILREDIPLEDLNLSVRAKHCLYNNGLRFASELFDLTEDDLFSMRNMGVTTVQEVLLKREGLEFEAVASQNPVKKEAPLGQVVMEAYIKEITPWIEIHTALLRRALKQPIEEYVSENADQGKTVQDYLRDPELKRLVWSQDLVRIGIKKYIIKELEKEAFGLTLVSLRERMPNFLRETHIIGQLLQEKYAEGDIIFTQLGVERQYPTVFDYAQNIEDERTRAMVLGRLEGRTLEELGCKFNLTRERVRQKVAKVLQRRPRLMEDKYAGAFQTYEFSKEDFMAVFNETEVTFNYLKLVYSKLKGSASLEDLVADKNFPLSVRKRAEEVVFKDFITVNGERLQLKRHEIIFHVLKTYFQEESTLEEYISAYNKFLLDHGLESNENLTIDERTLQNRLAEADYVLWKFNKRFRYYDIAEYDFDELLQALALEQYSDVEYSSLKIFRDFADLMEVYDIRDEYELHNLLRKLYKNAGEKSINFKRMPTIEFGHAERDMQVLDLLLEYAPVSTDDLANAYEQEYGVRAETVKANYLKSFDEFYHNGRYYIDQSPLPFSQARALKAALTEDFYSIAEIKEIFEREIPRAKTSRINPYTIKTLGFKVFSNYAIRKTYPTALEYFRKVLTEKSIIDLRELPKAMTQAVTFTTELTELRKQYEIVEFSPSQYVNIRCLEDRGITKENLRNYCDAVFWAAKPHSYFTVHSLKRDGFTHVLDDFGFEEWFYSSILSQDHRFSNRRMGKSRVFVKGKHNLLFKDFIKMIVQKQHSIDVGELLQLLEEDYGLNVPRHKVMEIVNSSSVFYNQLTEKFYTDYHTYAEEA